MKGRAPARVRRVSVSDPIAAARRYDYADAFELRLEGPDRCSPEEWVRAGVDATPAWLKRLAGHADGLGSARIVESDADVVVLEDSDPLMDTVMVGRNVEPERRMLTTVLRYRRPLLARAMGLYDMSTECWGSPPWADYLLWPEQTLVGILRSAEGLP